MDENFRRLHEYVAHDKYLEAKLYLEDLSSNLQNELSESIIDNYILNIFDELYGLLNFIQKIVNKPVYKDLISEAITSCMDIIYMLVNNSHRKIEKYTPRIRDVCFKVLLTSNSKARVKGSALKVFLLIIEKTDYFPKEFISKEETFAKLYNYYESAKGEVMGYTVRVMGVMLKKYPCIIDNPAVVYNSIMLKLKVNIRNDSEGPAKCCFFFLSAFLEVYPDADLVSIYQCVKERMAIGDRKPAQREAISLLQKHISLFERQIHEDAEFWYNRLNKWLDTGGEYTKVAFYTLNVLYSSLSKTLAADTPENRLVCMKFWTKFVEDIFSSRLHGYHLRLAIRGFGHFVFTAKIFLTNVELNSAIYDFINKVEQTYLINFDSTLDDLDYLPEYIQSLSNIIQQINNITEYELGILQRATVLVIKLFPQLAHHHHNMVVIPTITAYYHVRKSAKSMATLYLLNTVREGVIYSCSHAVVSPDVEYYQNITTYRNYLPFWHNFINNPRESYSFLSVDSDVSKIQKEIFDEFMATLLYLMEKLNLSTRIAEEFSTFSDPKITLEAVKVNDFNIFVNVSDLYVDVLQFANKNLFKTWVQRFLNKMMVKSKKYPLVSGFYKLLAVGLKISNDLRYFDGDRLAREDVRLCYDTIRDSVTNIISKVKLYKDDLKISCIKVILSTPVSIISGMLINVVPVMVSLFTLGRSNLELAEIGMDALELWSKEIKQEEFDPFLGEILPHLDSYLCSRSISEKFDAKEAKITRTKKALSRRKIVTISEGDLFKIQKRILTFIVGLSNDMCRSFVENSSIIGDNIFYSKNLHLKVKLMFPNNFHVDLYMEKFILRIVELALYCSERKLRINACEVLHSLVLVFLGRTKEMSESPKEDLHGVLKNLINALLFLGCDADMTVQKILRPLMLQLMHWYSSKLMKLCSHTAIVVETVLDGVTQTADSAVRDFSCLCIKEFVDWSIKQSSKSGIAKDPINIHIVLRKIKFFSSHSDPSKRFAAALIFNNIYTILREETYIFQIYWIELLHCFVMNLSLIDEYDEYNCLTQVHASLDHLQRGFVEKSHIFNKSDKDRRIPPNFENCLLTDVACWLLKQTGSPNRHCRDKCYSLFKNIAPLCEKGSLQDFITYYQRIHGKKWMQALYLHNYSLQLDTKKFEGLFKWMSDFQCLLDAYIFFEQYANSAFQENDVKIIQENFKAFYDSMYSYNTQKLSPMDKEYFSSLSTNIVKKYLRHALKTGVLKQQEYWNLFMKIIFENNSLLAEEVHVQEVNDFLNIMQDNILQSFTSSMKLYLTQNCLEHCNLNFIVPFKQRQILKGLLILKNSCLSEKICVEEYISNGLGGLFDKMIGDDRIVVNLQNMVKEYCELRIELALKSGDIEILINYICNDTLVKVAHQRDEIQFGRYIFDTFKSTIIDVLIDNFELFVKTLVIKLNPNSLYFIEEIVQFLLSKKKTFNENLISRIVNQILTNWVAFKEFYDNEIGKKVKGLKLLEIISYLMNENRDANLENTEEPCMWTLQIIDFLTSSAFDTLPHKRFEYLNSAITVLPLFLKYGGQHTVQCICDRLTQIEENNFTNLSKDFMVVATVFVNKAFQAAISSKSKHLFNFASKLFILVQPKDDLNVDQLCKVFMKSADTDLQLQLLHALYTFDYSKYSLDMYYKFTKEIMVNILRYTDYEVFVAFYTEYICGILNLIQKTYTNYVESAKKSVAFILARILFSRLNIEQDVDEVTCSITKSAYPDTTDSKQLVKQVMNITSQLLKDTVVIEDEAFRKWDRICKCECYNALISAVCNMQREPVWYNLLFKREVKGCNYLWRNIIDEKRDYTFSMDFEKIPKKKESLVAIRSTYRAKKKQSFVDSLKYIESQNILNSTISEDIVKYDFTKTILRSQEISAGSAGEDNNRIEMQVDIDGDELNSHECMLMLCGLFQFLHDEKIYNVSPSGVPTFVDSIRKDLENEDTPRNVKLFLIKALENKQELFKPYAKGLFAPIMKAIVDGICGNNINYFVTDLIVMLVCWAEGAENLEANESASELVHFLVKNINTDRRDIMKYHIDLLKFFVEQWKQYITVPKDYLLIQLRTLAKSKKVLPIIHVCSIFLANDLPPWNDMKIFMTKLIEVLAHDSRYVYRSCAEAIGTALLYSKKNETESTLTNFTKFLVKYFKHRNKRPDEKDLICLQAITKHYPEFGDPFFTSLIYEYSKYRGQYKMICLKMFLDRINALHENPDFPIIKLGPLISDDSNTMKVLGLEIIRKTLPVIYLSANAQARLVVRKEDFLNLLETISRFLTSENNVCRSVTYEIFMDIYHNDRFNSHDDIKNKCKDVLLQGLVDHNEEIEEKIKEFWAKILPANTSEKFLFLLRDMYKTSIETSYLGYYVNFILNELALRDEYQEAIFEYDLADCIFTDYQIKDNWRERHSTLAPLFAQSYRSQTADYDSSTSASTIGSNMMMLRATNYSMEFEPTQRATLLEDEKQNMIDEDIDPRGEEEEDEEGEENADDKIFKKPWPVKLRKKRFFNDETRTVRGFALRKLEESSKVEKARTDLIKQRQQQVNIYRTYRRGDFPDIKLSVSDIITPLKIIVKHDNRIAKIFYTILFESITNKVTDNEDSFVKSTIEGVKNIFEISIVYDTNVIGALLDVALKHKSKFHFLPDVIAKVSFNSGLLWSGALLLEGYLIDGFDNYESDEGPSPKRSRGFSNSAEVDCWVKLADIYKELEEWDLVRTIFRYKMQSNEHVIQAIVEESQSNWRDAQDLYLAAIQDNPPTETLGFYYESCYKCFAELSDWDALAKSVKQSTSVDNYWDELWDEDWQQQKLLPWFMIAQLRNSLVSEEAKISFVSDINSALSNTDKLLYIKQNFSEEIAFLYLLTGDFDKVNYFLTNNIELFLSNWSNLSPLLTSLKMKKLLMIQSSLEIYNFITKFNTFNTSNKNSILNDMCKTWLKVYNESLTSIVSSETKTIYRTQCLSVLQTKFESEDVKQRLGNVKFQLDMNLANMALGMKNFHVCRKYLTRHDWCSDEQTKDGVMYRMTRSGLLCFKASKLDFDLQLEHIVDAWQHLAECMDYTVVTENLGLYLSTNLHVYDVAQDLSRVLLNNEKSIDDLDLQKQVNAITKMPPPYSSNSIGNYGFNTLQEALINAKDVVDNKDDNNLKSIADGHYKLACFVSSYSNRNKDLIIHVLNAMFYGSSEARYMFPCLLEIADLGTVYKETFLTEACRIPEWMFIQWIPQLLANLDTQNITIIYPIVEKIAKMYPQAIIYPYRLSKQKYSFPDSIKNYGEQAVTSLDRLLQDPLAEKFLTALSSVSLWYNVLSYHIKQLERACDISSDLFNERLNALKLMCDENIDYKHRNSLKGQVFKEIIGHLKTKILPLAKDKFNVKSIKAKLAQHRSLFKELASSKSKGVGNKTDSTKKLSYYSPWLEHFSDNEVNLNLEIPGQYKGDKMPLLKHHVKICGFSSEVLKFNSLRSPLKLTIIGSDAKEYPFLVKLGEDLRQDQRIEQIFGLMNNIFNADSVCREKRLNIRTYQVIPLTGILGLIECVPNAVTYSEFLNNTVSDFNKTADKARIEYKKCYLNNKDQYLESLLRHKPELAMKMYHSIVNLFPQDLFQQAIRKLSVDSESFVVLRNKFITSHAVNCIADWILGIGDRHLGNSMVCLKSGQTMDIDFGFAFGLSVQIIPYPEVVPIRLTPHFLELTQPLKEHGLIEETMVHVLRALRNNSTSLLSTMSVFIKEPSLEWMEFKLHENKVTGYNWDPQKKLDHARRKLNGASSVDIMVEELSDRTTSDRKYNNGYISFVKRNRTQFTGNLSVEDQVACLIDHATDYNLLVRVFAGFEAWI